MYIANTLINPNPNPNPKPNPNPNQVCIANTHINASVEFADVKLWQTQHLLMEVERMMTQISGSINTLPMVRHRRRLHRHRVVPSSPPPP